MNRWTDSAQARLEEYSARVRLELQRAGVDVEEVAEDLRRHVHEEVEAEKLPIVTEQDVSRILDRIGTPRLPADTTPAAAHAGGTSPANNGSAPRAKAPGGFLLFFGVLLPLGTIIFEFLTGVCAGVLFNPLPTPAHVLLTLTVPLANLGAWLVLRRGDRRWDTRLGWANGAATTISAVYALLLVPFIPFALIGIAIYGLGLVPLSPLLALISTIVLRDYLRRDESGHAQALPGFWRGGAAGVVLLTLFTLPLIVTRLGLDMAASDSEARRTRGVNLLRSWGQNEEMLRACYGRQSGAGELYVWSQPIPVEKAREVYYRVTGRPFNAVPPPKLYAGRARWSVLEQEFTWDNDQGGDAVAGRLKGLSLVGSRQDGFIDPEAALAYLEWTLEFQNISPLQREARAQLLLPPGAVVSRLTLWIDGEEREAAFGARSQVKSAYKSVVSARRDPVLVTTCGPDRVLVQCFPIAPAGGKMKVRLGVTAPLAFAGTDSALLRPPCFLERNFTIAEEFRHSVWLESATALVPGPGSLLVADRARPGAQVLRGDLEDQALNSSPGVVRVDRTGRANSVWARDPQADGAAVVQTVASTQSPPPDRIVLVLDGAKAAAQAGRDLSSVLEQVPEQAELAVLVAQDGCREVRGPSRLTPAARQELAGQLRKLRGIGGHDNVPALVRAWDLAANARDGVIVWIHGDQPALLESTEALRQRFQRRSAPPRLISVPVQAGPNRVLEQLDGIHAVTSEMRLGSLSEDLSRLFRRFGGTSPEWTILREQLTTANPSAAAASSSAASHLARLWAAGQIARLSRQRDTEQAMQLASRYQLVTPVSGAVVLETRQQYEQAGLEPVAPDSVPAVPEPSAGILVLFGTGFLVLRRWIRRALRGAEV